MIRLACMFPGQGSQSIGMLKSLADADTVIQETFNIAREVLGVDYWNMVQNGPESALNDTLNTQVVMLIADVALFRYLRKHGMPKVEIMAGHSLGEYAALVCSDSISFEDALGLVQKRAKLMQKAVLGVSGAMAAIIGLSDEDVRKVCEKIAAINPDMVLSPANFNAQGQIVIAGHKVLVEQAIVEFEKIGARMAKIIPVSVPCHCDLMRPAVEEFVHELSLMSFAKPSCQVISNVDLSIYESAEDIRRLLAEQLYKPVRWTDTLGMFVEQGMDACIESGPGKVLSGLAKRTVPGLKNMFCYEPQHLPVWE
jgi:[acyl-carrier-protein] S-malonyltransferase